MSKILAIALTTYRESVRSKILYSILGFAAIIVLVGALFGTVTIGDQIRVIKDFGLFGISIFTVAFTVISGSSLLAKELSKKTVYNILSKSVHRWEFLVGKYLGMVFTVVFMTLLMGLSLSVFVYFFEGDLDLNLFYGYAFISLELMIICAVAIFFSSIVVTPLLTGLFTFGVFLAGRSSEDLLYFVNNGTLTGPVASILKGLHTVLPNLATLNISNAVVYGKVVPISALVWGAGYAMGYSVLLLSIAVVAFMRREFN